MTRLSTKRLRGNGYGIAVLATFSLWLCLESLQPVFRGNSPVLLFLVGVMLAAWCGGFRAGVLATVLSVLVSAYFLVEPYHSWQVAQPSEQLRLLLFAGVGGALSLTIACLRQAERRALREALRQKERLEREITTRQQAEQALTAAHLEAVTARNRLEALMEALPVGVALIDIQGGHLRGNRAFEQVWGGPRPVTQSVSDYAAYQAWWVDTGRLVRPEEWASAQAVRQGRTVVGQVLEIARFDGTRAFVHNSAAPIRDESGRIVGSAVALMDVTAQLQSEAARRESEERFRLFMDHSPTAAWIKDAEGRYTYLNHTCEDLLGIRLEDWRGRTDAELWPAETAAQLRRNDQAVLAAGRPIETTEETFHPDSGQRTWLSCKFLFRDAAGNRYVAGIGLDITERRRTEAALRQSQEDLAMALEAAQLGTWHWDILTGAVDWSPQCKALYGLPADADITYERFLQAVHPADRECVEAALRDTVEKGSEYRLEKRILRPDGTERWTASRGRCFLDETGRPVRVAGVSMDITERKRAEEVLQQALSKAEEGDRLLSALMDYVPEGITIADAELNLIRVSRYGQKLLGGHHAGQSIAEVAAEWKVHHADGVTPMAFEELPLVRAIARGEVVEDAEIVQLNAHGQPLPLLCTAGPWRDSAGTIVGGIVAWRDIAERKRAEERLREADRRKTEFLAMLGHELRNPLAPIRNAVQIMKAPDLPEPKRRWAREVIDRQTAHLTRLVDDLLDVSRIVQGKLALKKVPLNLARVIEQAVEAGRPFIELRRHTLAVSLPREPLRVEGDEVRLTQVVTNLLDNAAKYTPEGGRIWVAAAYQDGEAVIMVRDTGEGIPGALLPYLFEVFTQGERSLDRAQGGLGLGLAIVQNLVALHGGRIEARSEGPGQGSEFVVCVPLLECELQPARSRRQDTPEAIYAPMRSLNQ